MIMKNLQINMISHKLKSITLNDLTLVLLSCLAIYLFRGREYHQILPLWHYEPDGDKTTESSSTFSFSKHQNLPNPVVTDLESDGINEVILITKAFKLEILVLPEDDPHDILPLLFVKNSTQLPRPAEIAQDEAPYPVALETGFLDEYQGMVQVRTQVIVVVFSNWRVMCFDHTLRLLWHQTLFDTRDMGPEYRPKSFTLLISPHRVVKGDRGTIIIGGSFVHKSHSPREWTGSQFSDRSERSPGGIDPNKMKAIREKNKVPEGEEEDRTYTHFSTFCLSGSGKLRWHHLPSDFKRKDVIERPPPIHWKLELSTQKRHSGEQHWTLYKTDLYAQLPYSWSNLGDTRMELTVFKKNSHVPYDLMKPEVNTVADVFGHHIAGYAYGGSRPHSHHEHVQHPNALVIHTHEGVEVLNLFRGAPIARLDLGEEKTTFADVNEDGSIERIKANFHGNNCDAEVVSLQQSAQVLFTGPICSSPTWFSGFTLSNLFMSFEADDSENTHVSLPPMVVQNIAVHSSPAHHLMGRTLPSQKIGYDSIFMTSSGRLTSYGPYGEFNWQSIIPSTWNTFTRHSRSQLTAAEINQIYEKQFQPSMKAYSPKVYGKTTAGIISGWNHFTLVDLEDGHILADHTLPCQPVSSPTLGDFNNDGWTDFIISCNSGHIGFRMQSKPSYIYLGVVTITVVLGMYMLTWCLQPDPDHDNDTNL